MYASDNMKVYILQKIVFKETFGVKINVLELYPTGVSSTSRNQGLCLSYSFVTITGVRLIDKTLRIDMKRCHTIKKTDDKIGLKMSIKRQVCDI